MNQREAGLDQGSAALLAAPLGIVAHGKTDRLITLISCASESGIDSRRLKQLLLIGLAVLAIFGVAEHAFPVLSGPSRTLPPLPFQLFNLVLLSVAALGVPWLDHNWRWWALGFCLILITSVTVAGIVVDEDDPLLMTLFALIIISAVTIPWEAKWQGGSASSHWALLH